MTAPAAIQGDYVDLRFIKSRKVCQIVIEVPIEAGAAFVSAFGTPNPANGVPVALARLNGAASAVERKGGKLAQKAGILCNEGAFAKFLMTSVQYKTGGDLTSPASVASAMRDICGVQSRVDLDHDEEAGKRFLDLVAAYEVWLKVAA